MRYLKVFRAPMLLCICMALTAFMYSEKNSEETLHITPSNNYRISDTNSKNPEGIINVGTSSNYGVFTQTVFAEVNDTVESNDNINIAEQVSNVNIVDETETSKIIIETETKQENDAETDSNNYSGGIVKTVPSGRGSNHTFMGWQLITSKSSSQYKLRAEAGENYDADGFAKIDDRYVVAVKPYYGKIGDYIDVYKSNGEIIKCIIGDAKGSDGGGDKYSHADGSVVEFVVDKYSWYSKYNGLGRYKSVGESHPSWTVYNITKIVNLGNYWS